MKKNDLIEYMASKGTAPDILEKAKLLFNKLNVHDNDSGDNFSFKCTVKDIDGKKCICAGGIHGFAWVPMVRIRPIDSRRDIGAGAGMGVSYNVNEETTEGLLK